MKPRARTQPGVPPLICYPVPFEALTGLNPSDFVSMVRAVKPAVEAVEAARRNRPGRIRAPGAGRRHSIALPDRIFAALLVSRFAVSETRYVGYLVGSGRDTVRRAVRMLVPIMVSGGHGRVCKPLSFADRQSHMLTACRGLPNHGGLLQYLAMRCGLLVIDDEFHVLIQEAGRHFTTAELPSRLRSQAFVTSEE